MKDILAIILGGGRGTRLYPLTEQRCKSGLFVIIFSLFILFHSIIIGGQRLYPFIDLPFHLAAVTIVQHYEDNDNSFKEYYEIDRSLKANIFHLYFCLCSLFSSIEFANKVFYLLYVISFPLSILFLIRQYRGSLWFSLLGFLVLYNFNLIWGFTGFTIALPTFFIFFAYLIREDQHPTKAGILVVIILLLALFFMHALVAFLGIGSVILSLFIFDNHRSTIFRKLLMIAPVSIMMILWWLNRPPREISSWRLLKEYYRDEFLATSSQRLILFYADNYSLFAGVIGKIAGVCVTLIILLPLFLSFRHGKLYSLDTLKNRSVCFLLGFIFTIMVLCFFLPQGIEALCWYLYPRFTVFALVGLIILGSVLYRSRTPKLLIFLLVIFPLILSMFWADYFLTFDRENEDFDQTIMPHDRSARMGGLMYDFRYRGRPQYIHFPNYHIIWNRGIATTRLIEYRFLAVRRKTSFEEMPMYHEWITPENPYDGRYGDLEYLLVRGHIPKQDKTFFDDFQPVFDKDPWFLFQHTSVTEK